MKLDCKVPVKATKEAIWNVITDFEHIVDNITAITKAEILEQPPGTNPKGDVTGLKWSETRVMFGKEATETMWITDCVVNEYYQTRAENCGAIYISRMYITNEGSTDDEGNTKTQSCVGMSFEGECETFWAKVMSFLLGWMMVGTMKKAVMEDLNDIKRKAESM